MEDEDATCRTANAMSEKLMAATHTDTEPPPKSYDDASL
jgi:hypothetical protein